MEYGCKGKVVVLAGGTSGIGLAAAKRFRKDGAMAVSTESTAFPNLDYSVEHFVGPGEIIKIRALRIRHSFLTFVLSRLVSSMKWALL